MSNQFLICICNDEYAVSLETRKLYQKIPDAEAEQHHYVRVIDESGEDYLYPESYFVAVQLPAETERAVLQSS